MFSRALILFVWLLFLGSSSLFAAENAYKAANAYKTAFALKQRGEHAEAIEAFLQAAEHAKTTGNSLTEFSSYYGASYSAHALSRPKDCKDYAERALAIIAAHPEAPWVHRPSRYQYEAEMIGLAERSCSTLARLGEGWQLNRRGIALLREAYGDASLTGPLEAAEVVRFPVSIRWLGWRFLEREAEYLHETCRTEEARRLLSEAIELAQPDLAKRSRATSFYPLKLVGSLALIEGFVGNEERSVALYQAEYDWAKGWSRQRNLLRIRMNLLAEKADYQGADSAMIEEADAIAKEFAEAGYPRSGAIERMRVRIAASQMSEAMQLERLLDATREGLDEDEVMDAFYASRNALFVRAARNDPDLDADFHEYLIQTREQGNLRAEPRIYRRYADWLVQQGRLPEGIRAYRSALDRTLAAGWHPQVPKLYGKIAAALLSNGRPDEAEQAWNALLAYAESHPSIPPHQLLKGYHHWLMALLKAGRTEEARQLARQASNYAEQHDLPQIHRTAFSTAFLDRYLADIDEENAPPSPPTDDESASTFLHPGSLTTVGVPGYTSRAALFLINPSSRTDHGVLEISGAPVVVDSAPTAGPLVLRRSDAQHPSPLRLPLSVEAGQLLKIYLLDPNTDPNAPTTEPTVELIWLSEAASDGPAARWHYDRGASTGTSTVIDAARISNNPFIGTPVEHTIVFPSSETSDQRSFRVRSDGASLRIEYRDPVDGRILAVDQNGNGNFQEPGDFWTPGSPLAAPTVHRTPGSHLSGMEVWYFPNQSDDVDDRTLHVELYLEGAWTEQAVDQLRSPSQ